MGTKPINKVLRGIRDSIPAGYILGRVGSGSGPPILLPAGNFATKGYVAGTTIQIGGTAGGDLSGTYPDPTVAKIQGVAVKNTAPTNSQVLTYVTADTKWEPETPHYIPAGGTTGQVLEKNSGTDYDVSWDTPAGSSGAPASIQDTGTAIELAISDSNGQLVLDGSGNPIFAPEVFPASALTNYPLSTRQVLTSGTAATYTTPAGCRQLRIRMVGGAGGGAGSSSAAIYDAGSGGNGTDSIFNSIHAGFGNGAPSNQSGSGASAGIGSASFRILGAAGTWSTNTGTAANELGGNGGDSPFGGSGSGQPSARPGIAASLNSGSGGGGGGIAAGATSVAGGGGQAGEYLELVINSPAATYTYTVGALGAAGAAGTGGQTGGAGGAGLIIVDELY